MCLHDPLWNRELADLDRLKSDKILGISCTGLAFIAPDWVNAHPARKLIVHRASVDIRASLERLGLPMPKANWPKQLRDIHGYHICHDEVLEPTHAKEIFEWLTGCPLDAERHAELVKMNVQPAFGAISVDGRAARKLVNSYVREATK